MGIVLDLILLALLALSIFMGYKKGLIKVIFSFCAFIIAIIVTVVLYNPVAKLVIDNTEIDDNLKNTILENGIIKESTDEEKPNSLNEYIEKYVAGSIANAANNVVEQTAGVIAEKIVAIGVAIVLFIVVRLGLILLRFVAGGIASLPIIKQFDKAGGTLYGILRGIITVYVVLAVMFFVVSLNNSEFITTLIDTSIVSKFLYSNNIILNIIFG